MVFKATFNNLSVISRLSVLLVHVIGFIMKFNKQYTYLPQMSTTNYQLMIYYRNRRETKYLQYTTIQGIVNTSITPCQV